MSHREQEIAKIKQDWAANPRWKGVKRGYTAEDVYRLRGSVQIEHTLAKRGAEKLWKMTNEMPFVNSLGAVTGNQALQQKNRVAKRSKIQAGAQACCVSYIRHKSCQPPSRIHP